MKNFKNSCLSAVLGVTVCSTTFLTKTNGQTLSGPECSEYQDNRRKTIGAYIRLGGSNVNGEPTAWINVGDQVKCKTSQDDQCSGETAYTLSQP